MRVGITVLGAGGLFGLLTSLALWATASSAIVREAHANPPQPVAMTSFLRFAVGSRGPVANILLDDAYLFGGLSVVDPRYIPADRINEDGLDKKAWIELGVQAMARHRIEGREVHFELYDFAKGSKPALVRTYSAKDLRTAAHRFSDAMAEYWTGTSGDFDSRIAFVRDRGGAKNVFTMDVNGDRVQAITDNRSLNILPSLGPGGVVLFTSYAKRNPDLWWHEGGRAVRVSKRPGLNLGGVSSPDGRSIALALSVDGDSELYTLDPQGSIRARLTHNPASDGSPTWNATGNALAFVSDRAGTPQIHRVNAEGGGIERMTNEGDYNVSPDWAKGKGVYGRLLAYVSRVDSRVGVFILDPESGKVTATTSHRSRQESPSWSPSGRMLAFENADPPGIAIWPEPGWFSPIVVHRGGSQPSWGPTGAR